MSEKQYVVICNARVDGGPEFYVGTLQEVYDWVREEVIELANVYFYELGPEVTLTFALQEEA